MLMSLMSAINITGEYILWINILMAGCQYETVHGFYSYYHPLTVTAFGTGAASVIEPKYNKTTECLLCRPPGGLQFIG